jgi:hypothetical protein
MDNPNIKSRDCKTEPKAVFTPAHRRALAKNIRASGSIKSLAKQMGVSYSFLANAANQNLPLKFSVHHLPGLFKASGDCSFLRFLAQECGYAVLGIPDAEYTKKHQSILVTCFQVSDEWGKLARVLKSLWASDLGEEEKLEVLRKAEDQVWDLITVLFILKSMLEQQTVDIQINKESRNGMPAEVDSIKTSGRRRNGIKKEV